MLNNKTKEVCALIGQFYLKKNGGDYDKTKNEIESLRIESVVVGSTEVIITLGRVGLLIGKRGENIDALQKHLGLGYKLIIRESRDNILNYIIPENMYPEDEDSCYMDDDWTNFMETDEDKIGNLLLNMSGGLLPKDLSDEDVKLLTSKFGLNWFEKLGYTEPEYQKPK